MTCAKQLAACISLAWASLAFADWSGWHPDAYGTNATTEGVFRFASTNAVRADLYACTNVVTYTNQTAFGVSTTITARFLSNVRIDDWQGPHTLTNDWIYTLRRYYTNGLFSNVVYTARVVSTLAVTSLLVQARDAWAIDGYRAAKERYLAAGYEWTDAGYDLYARNQELLVFIKARLSGCLDGDFIDHTNATWRAGSPPPITNQHVSLDIHMMTNKVAGMPTNWPDYTPWRELNGAGVGMGRIATTTWVVVGGTGTVTNTSVNVCGDAVTLTGTNGQIIVGVCTNDEIAEGYTTLDYGWKFVRPFATNLQVTRSSFAAFVSEYSNATHISISTDQDEAAAVAALCSSQACVTVAVETNSTSGDPNYQYRLIYEAERWENNWIEPNAPRPLWVTNAGAAAWRVSDKLRAWSGVGPVSTTATGIFYGAYLPQSYQFYNGSLFVNQSGTNLFSNLYGWPLAATSTASAYVYAGNGMAQWATNGLSGAWVTNAAAGEIPDCDNHTGEYNGFHYVSSCDGTYWLPVETPLNAEVFRITIGARTYFDWTGSPTNGFRYR